MSGDTFTFHSQAVGSHDGLCWEMARVVLCGKVGLADLKEGLA